MSEKFDDFDGLEMSLESEVSDVDLPKAKGKVALSVRMLMVLALMMIAPQVMAKGKKAKAAPATAPVGHTLTLTSEEAKKTDPWKMDLNKMMEAFPENFAPGVDPFKEMGREQPDLFLCDDIPKVHTDKFGDPEKFSSVIFQTALLVEASIKNHINAEKGRLKKLPNVVRLLNIAGYKSLDDKVKELKRKVNAEPENTREWHAIAMDLLDMGVAIINSVDDFVSSPDINKKDTAMVKKINDIGKKMIEKTRAQLGYHGNLDEKQWKSLVGNMLKEAEGLVRLIGELRINNAYVTPRKIDFDRIPESYHAQTRKAIEILEALEKDSKPNLKRWQELQKRMAELNEHIKKAVNMESAMGKKRHRCAQSPEPIQVGSLGMMQKTRGTVDSDNPDYYDEVPQVARPLPYHCSYVDPEHGRGPGVVMALKDLEERVKDFIEAGMQRQAAYAHAERSAGIMEDPTRKSRFTMIASGAKEMDEILAEWMDILDKIIDLRRDLEKTAGTELRAALDLRRCNVPVAIPIQKVLQKSIAENDSEAIKSGILKQFGYRKQGVQADGNHLFLDEGDEKNSVISRLENRVMSVLRETEKADVSFRSEAVQMANGKWVIGVAGASKFAPTDLKFDKEIKKAVEENDKEGLEKLLLKQLGDYKKAECNKKVCIVFGEADLKTDALEVAKKQVWNFEPMASASPEFTKQLAVRMDNGKWIVCIEARPKSSGEPVVPDGKIK